jgi:RNA recognition motif-containing protein
LYIGNLPFDCSVAELEELFREKGFDSVRRVHLPSDPEGRPRGFGFISLATADDARRAVDELSECSVRGRRLSISVARARGTAGAPVGRPPRPPGATGGGPGHSSAAGSNFGGSYPPPHAAPRFTEPAAGFGPPQPGFSEGPAGEGRAARWDKDKEKDSDKKKEKKRKVKAAPAVERGTKRRRDDGFRSTRAQDYVDDWDDD